MERRSLVLSLFAIGCFIATATLIPGLGTRWMRIGSPPDPQ